MMWTQAKAVAVLAAVGTSAQGFLAKLNQQAAAWVLPPTTTTTIISSSTSQIGSPPIGGPATPGDGADPAGTMIISWSTQHFTVTTGIPDGAQSGGSITDGGEGTVMPTPTGGRGSSQPSGAGPPVGGEATAGLSGDASSQTGIVVTGYGGDMPPPSGAPQPGSVADDEDEFMASILAGGPEPPQQASAPGPIPDGGAAAPGSPIPRSSQTGLITGDDGSSGGMPPAVPTGGGPASSEPMVSGTAAPSAPPSDVFVIQLGPAAVSSASTGPVGRRQDDHGGNNNNNKEYLTSAGAERSGGCAQAARFEIVDGELTARTRGGQKEKVSAGPGPAPPQRLAASGPAAAGPVTRSWVISGGELLWLNESFAGGRAGFCEDEDGDGGTRTVFFTTRGQGEGEGGGGGPAGCVPLRLTPIFVADCPGLSNPDGDSGDLGLLPAEETLILPPGVYFPGGDPKDMACKVTTAYWTVGQFTLAPAPTGVSREM